MSTHPSHSFLYDELPLHPGTPMPWHRTPEGEGTCPCRRERDFVRLSQENRVRSDTELADPEVMRDLSCVLEDNCNLFSFPNCDFTGMEGPFSSLYRDYVWSFLFVHLRAKGTSP